jgi:hypothetical protein
LCVALLVSGFAHVHTPHEAAYGQGDAGALTAVAETPLDGCHDETGRTDGDCCYGIWGCSVFALTPDAGVDAPAALASATALPPPDVPNGVAAAPSIHPPTISA